jgi:hypothetical protein
MGKPLAFSLNWKEMVMMTALIAATLCSVFLARRPAKKAVYIYAKRKDRFRHR